MPLRRLIAAAGVLALAVGLPGAPAAQVHELLVQPFDGPAGEPAAQRELAHYLRERTGTAIDARTSANTLAHWRRASGADGPALVLDEAHFTSYRMRRHGYQVLVKFPGLVGHSVVTAPGNLLLDVDELHGRTVAVPAPPALGTTRLLGLFPDPVRRPVLIEAADADAAVAALLSGRAHAALVRSRLVTRYPTLNVVMDAEPLPAPALSASPAAAGVAAAVRDALLAAHTTAAGRRVLAGLGVARFEAAEAEAYEGHGALLRGTWGYAPPP